ncbi:ATP-binding protein [Kitasatospora sp. NPDC049258]|uniref:ATP-binding protein n=1 Tax=Kitasatospora sp. NPDC049258 TaxID=3155394 RepID=UPI0034392CA3
MPETLDRPPGTQPAHPTHPAPPEQSRWLPRRPRSARAARRLLREFLAGLPDGQPYLWAGELLLSELVTNAVSHARVPPGRKIQVRLAVEFGRLRIEVHDASAALPSPTVPAELDESGRGMHLVALLSEAWGVGPRPGGPGKVVWATVAPEDGREERRDGRTR